MIKKFIVSLLCVVFITGMIFTGFLFLYFTIPSKDAMSSISLPSSVEDTVSASSTEETEESSDVYVADVRQSLTLRSAPSSSSERELQRICEQ